jgi:DsbC/DsbD-like thiol-disulfide interchange protein
MKIANHEVRLTVAGCMLLAGTAGAASAEDASRWDGDARSAVRLIAGSRSAGSMATLRAGIQIRLKPGWHTYWRYPGDAGVPPRFEFQGSQNIKHVDVLWPAPQRLSEEGGVSIGYASDLVLPLRIVPENVGKPVTLRLKLAYAICEKLCVPAEAKAELTLPSGAASQDAALAAAEARVPKRAAPGEGRALVIHSVRSVKGPGQPHVVVDLAAPPGGPVELFAEGPNERWALPVPAAVDGAPAGLRRFTFELDGAPPGENYAGALLLLTAVAGSEAIEVPIRLD